MGTSTLAESAATVAHQRLAWALVTAVSLFTIAMLPVASTALPTIPGFIAVYQTALIIAFALSALILIGRFKHDRSLPLLILRAGSVFTLQTNTTEVAI